MPLTLTRELRIGLHETDAVTASEAANGFAGNPALVDIAPFLTLAVTISGAVDPLTGMLVNIKHLDRVMRQHAVPFLRTAFYKHPRPAGTVTVALFELLGSAFAPHTLTGLRLGASPYLSFSMDHREPAMVQMSLRFEFSAAHRLHANELSEAENWEVFGRCNNPNGHGHNYELEVTIAGPVNEQTGQVLGVGALQAIVNGKIIEVFDHKHLNLDCDDFRVLNPTVENIARVLYRRLKPHIPMPARLATLRLWETPKTMCEYSE